MASTNKKRQERYDVFLKYQSEYANKFGSRKPYSTNTKEKNENDGNRKDKDNARM